MERNVLVDRLKGYACFLVLFGHVIMGIRLSGINVPSFFHGLEQFIWSFHVPLFLFLSGVVYNVTGEWKGKKSKHGFILHKLLNLGVPYVAFSVVYIAINSFVGQANTESSLKDILYIWKTPIAQYWFLYVLFFLFCIWTVLSGLLKNWQITVVAVLLGYLLPYTGIPLAYFDVVLYSSLAFGVGTFVDFSKLSNLSSLKKWIAVILHVIMGVAVVLLGIIEKSFVKELMLLFGIYASIMFIALAQNIKFIADFLSFMNKYSFQIYLLHTIFTAGIRIVLMRLGMNNWVIHVVLGTVCGLVFSIIAAKVAEKVKFLNFFFFPSKYLKSKKAR